jgi:hypothetical protein
LPMVSTVVSTIAIAAIVAVEPAFAADAVPVGVPGPLVGAGIPALVVLAGGYWAIRKRRRG